MPFPKDVKRIEDAAPDLVGHKIDEFVGVDLMLKSYKVDDTRTYGQVLRLSCETEDGNPVEIYTFSQVIADQVEKLSNLLPVIITPHKEADYFTLL